jgi:hypothetical protein
LATWFLLLCGFYSTYSYTHEVWWYLRFVLPVVPTLVVSAFVVLRSLAGRFNPPGAPRFARWQTVSVSLLLLGGAGALYAVQWNYFHVLHGKHVDRTYWSVAEWFRENAPADSVVVTRQNSGSLIAYSDLTIVRWDEITPPVFELLRHRLAENHQPLYAAVLDWEGREVLARMPGTWKKHALIFSVEIWEYAAGSASAAAAP